MGSHKSRSGQEAHLYNPLTIHLLQEAARTGNYETFKQYTSEIDRDDKAYHLRSLMEFDLPEDGGIPLDEVELSLIHISFPVLYYRGWIHDPGLRGGRH